MIAAQASVVQVLSFGPEAVAAREGVCRLLGVTSKAIYLQTCDDRVLALVGGDAPDGPLSIRVPNLQQIIRTLEGGADSVIRLEWGAICFGDLLAIDLPLSRLWSPEIARIDATEIDSDLLGSIACLVSEQASQEGAAPLAFALAEPDVSSLQSFSHLDNQPVAARLAQHLQEAISALREGDEASAFLHLVTLLGVGPGLTPSGDDFLAGALAALKWQDTVTSFGSLLTDEVRVEAPKRTNRISVALLRYASEGVLYAPAMKLGHALGRGSTEDVRAATRHLLDLGANSGADTATGILAGLLIARTLATL